jgi:tripartite ATP-independent transporter DctM subunit
VAVTVTSATQGIIIPPSHNMVIYSLVAGGVSISALFLAGYIPGIMIGLSLMAVAYMVARRDKHPTEQRPPFRESLRISLEAIPGLGMGLVIIGGIVSGVFTATESAAIGAIYALLLSVFLYRELTWQRFLKVLSGTGRSIAVVIFLIATASAFGWMMAYLQIPSRIAEGMLSVSTTYVGVMLMVNILLLVLGSIMDFAPILLILTPVLLPVVQSVGVDPVHFGIIMMVNLAIGLTTPPVGTVLFVGCALAKIPIESVVKPMIPFWVAMLVVLLLITYVPGLVMLGPRLFGAG